ncbi:hypothetical protein MYX84_05200 [Acidobacteria bacterium AH-259-O06]|nr:hypothetical protein [Acidobacteria bacterium AH-259-O06]
MGVSEEVRAVEQQIDQKIEGLRYWQAPRSRLLRAVLEYYRDAIEAVYMKIGWARETGQPDVVQSAVAVEVHLHLGVLQSLKWAGTLCPESGGDIAALPNDEALYALVEQGHFYINFVDALKMAKHDLVTICLDQASGAVEVYEGGNVTGFDSTIIQHQHATNPFHIHSVLTHDTDQLTSDWNAADFRRVARKIVEAAEKAKTETVVSTLWGKTDLFKRPVVFEVPEPETQADAAVLEDLSFPSPKLAGKAIWNWTAWMDTPLVSINGKRYGVSSFVKTALGLASDSAMLRLAARVDPTQYSRVSQLREDRMIDRCLGVLKEAGWTAVPKFRLKNPDSEIDVFAEKDNEKIFVELKSTLRPESPWEAYKRNQEIIKGDRSGSSFPQTSASRSWLRFDRWLPR